ncbi:excinuclease ABC subunit UvrC [Candidatus Margulisiibacteriota bacterium]
MRIPTTKNSINARELNLPSKSGVYIMKDKRGRVLYIGKAKDLKKRVLSYFQKTAQHTEKTLTLVKKIANIDYILAPSEHDAFILENSLIKEHLPPYNIKLRDDKNYPYLKLTNDEYPRLMVVRAIDDEKAKYFGPFSEGSGVRKALRTIQHTFKIRTCKNSVPGKPGNKPCLNYHMHNCLAPCVYDVHEEYQKLVHEVTMLLNGKNTRLQEKIKKEMEKLSAARKYEEAGEYRDKLKALSMIQRRQKMVFHDHVDRDAIGIITEENKVCVVILYIREGKLNDMHHFIFTVEEYSYDEVMESIIGQIYSRRIFIPAEIYIQQKVTSQMMLEEWLSEQAGRRVKIRAPQRGQKLKVVEMAIENAREQLLKSFQKDEQINTRLIQLQKALKLDTLPKKIEAFDISNIMGKNMVASKVTFLDGKPHKNEYRRYNIKTLEESPNDTAAIYEVTSRRLKSLFTEKTDPPDLILIDGGKGQLNAALKARQEANFEDIPMVGLAKQEEELFLPGKSAPLKLPLNSPALLLLRQIRDEAHRFAITFHRKKRDKAMLE